MNCLLPFLSNYNRASDGVKVLKLSVSIIYRRLRSVGPQPPSPPNFAQGQSAHQTSLWDKEEETKVTFQIWASVTLCQRNIAIAPYTQQTPAGSDLLSILPLSLSSWPGDTSDSETWPFVFFHRVDKSVTGFSWEHLLGKRCMLRDARMQHMPPKIKLEVSLTNPRHWFISLSASCQSMRVCRPSLHFTCLHSLELTYCLTDYPSIG